MQAMQAGPQGIQGRAAARQGPAMHAPALLRPCRGPRPFAAASRRPLQVAATAVADAPSASASQPGDPASLLPVQLTWPARSHGCGAPRAADAGSRITICGWVDRNRDMGGVQFVDVRDHTGLLQVSRMAPSWAT
jgi:aspartyl-tRNA synthetase